MWEYVENLYCLYFLNELASKIISLEKGVERMIYSLRIVEKV